MHVDFQATPSKQGRTSMSKPDRALPRRSRGALSALVTLTALNGLSGCHKVTDFSDTTPIAVSAPAPAPAQAAAEPTPAPAPSRVTLKNDRIEIGEKIEFAVDKADISKVSHGLLDEVVAVLKAHPEISKLEILGHTDSEGADNFNLHLSDKRAHAVREYLQHHGVDASRLTAKGMGETQPIADNKTAEGREKNRRVEFMILSQGGTQ
jgi:outer membrane protein OmpA-like peptidoglycan-associated protein